MSVSLLGFPLLLASLVTSCGERDVVQLTAGIEAVRSGCVLCHCGCQRFPFLLRWLSILSLLSSGFPSIPSMVWLAALPVIDAVTMPCPKVTVLSCGRGATCNSTMQLRGRCGQNPCWWPPGAFLMLFSGPDVSRGLPVLESSEGYTPLSKASEAPHVVDSVLGVWSGAFPSSRWTCGGIPSHPVAEAQGSAHRWTSEGSCCTLGPGVFTSPRGPH